MRALTVQNPWAWAIAVGAKDLDNRARGLTHRGDIAIHAGLRWSLDGERDLRISQAIVRFPLDEPMPKGVVVAVAELWDSHAPKRGCCDSKWADTVYAGRRVGAHLCFRNIRRLTVPVPAVGRLTLWHLPGDVEHAVAEQLPAPAALL